MQEIELKFLVPDYKIDALMRQVDIKTTQTSQLEAHYFDTPDNDLAQAGAAIRIRKEGDDWVQTIKSGGDGLATRLEHNAVLDVQTTETALSNQNLMPNLEVYNDTEIPKQVNVIKQLIKAQNNDEDDSNAVLKPQYSTDVTRMTRMIKKDDAVIEVAYDEGNVVHGKDSSKSHPIHEIEFELIEGGAKALFEVAKTWCKRYKLCISTVTKAERGSLLLEDKKFADATKAKLKDLNVDDKTTQPEFMRAVVQNCLIQILPNATAIAAGSEDGNHVHQLRVGIRRLRTALKFFDGFSSDINPEWVPILKQTFSILGEYRDREVLQLKTQPMLEELGSPHVDWTPERESLKVLPIDAVRANDFQLTLLELIEYTMSSTENDEPLKEGDAKSVSKKVLKKLYKKISKASSHFADLDIEAQHDVRKRLKSLRYICEFVAPMYKKKNPKMFLKYLEPAQDLLGEYNDDMVGREFYLEKTKDDPNAWFAVGYFFAQEKHAAAECAVSLTTVKDAPKFW